MAGRMISPCVFSRHEPHQHSLAIGQQTVHVIAKPPAEKGPQHNSAAHPVVQHAFDVHEHAHQPMVVQQPLYVTRALSRHVPADQQTEVVEQKDRDKLMRIYVQATSTTHADAPCSQLQAQNRMKST